MYTDPLSQTPAYQRILKEGREEGDLNRLRKSLLTVVEVRFPSLMELAQERVPRTSSSDVLEVAFKALLKVDDEETARILIDLLPS
jgi:hypothetical protein